VEGGVGCERRRRVKKKKEKRMQGVELKGKVRRDRKSVRTVAKAMKVWEW
jgi:hypothetical protein